MTSLKRMGAALIVATLALGSSACKDFLDVNNNPNAPDHTQEINYLAPMMHWLATSEQFDGRFVGRYAQEWTFPPSTIGGTAGTWDRMGYDPTSDNAAQIYRDVYWNFGWNLTDMITQSEANKRYDLAGIGYILRGWGWLKLTELHGDIIVQEAFTPDKYRFQFDTQEYAMTEAMKLIDKGIEYLGRTDGVVDPAYIALGDKMFNGSAARWLQFAWGLKALALNAYSNKTSYNPQAVIDAVDKSFKSNAEDALFPYANVSATYSDDRNFWSVERQNLGSYRATNFMVGLMDGTQYPGAVDPRMYRMMMPDSTGTFHGVDPIAGFTSATKDRPWNLWGYYGTGVQAAGTPGRYLFDYRVKFPIMTYAQLQFVKAEALLKKGDAAGAKTAYLNGIGAHIDFVNARNAEIGSGMPCFTGTVYVPAGIPQTCNSITAAEKNAFLNNPSIAPATITLSHIMGQKFIAQWGWSHIENWTDMRRYHYTDADPSSGTQVYRNFAFPTTLYPDNNGKPVWRIRPRYNSDYVWNRDELYKIGGLALDYHTKPMWLFEK